MLRGGQTLEEVSLSGGRCPKAASAEMFGQGLFFTMTCSGFGAALNCQANV